MFLPESESEDATEDTFLRLQASPVKKADNSAADDEEEQIAVSLPQASRPGVYRLKRFRLDGEDDEQWLAMNVPTTESNLAVAAAPVIQQQLETNNLSVILAGVSDELSGGDAGREMRWFLLGLLIFVLICEQLLSLRMSFHPEAKS